MTKSPEEPLRVVDRRWSARAAAGDASGSETPDTSAALKPTAVEALERQLAERSAHLQQVVTEHRRQLDEFEQIKARMRREASRDVERGVRSVIAELLEVLDNLDRALVAVRGSSEASNPLLIGVERVRDQFLAKLEALGVTRLDVVGRPFDANLHDAVSMAPVSDAAQDGVVVAVSKEGYAMGGELLRPATVVVGRFDG